MGLTGQRSLLPKPYSSSRSIPVPPNSSSPMSLHPSPSFAKGEHRPQRIYHICRPEAPDAPSRLDTGPTRTVTAAGAPSRCNQGSRRRAPAPRNVSRRRRAAAELRSEPDAHRHQREFADRGASVAAAALSGRGQRSVGGARRWTRQHSRWRRGAGPPPRLCSCPSRQRTCTSVPDSHRE